MQAAGKKCSTIVWRIQMFATMLWCMPLAAQNENAWRVDAGLQTFFPHGIGSLRDSFVWGRGDNVSSGWGDLYLRPRMVYDLTVTREMRCRVSISAGLQFYRGATRYDTIPVALLGVDSQYRTAFDSPFIGMACVGYRFPVTGAVFLEPLLPVLYEQYTLEQNSYYSEMFRNYSDMYISSSALRVQAGLRAGYGGLCRGRLVLGTELRYNILKWYRETLQLHVYGYDAANPATVVYEKYYSSRTSGFRSPAGFRDVRWLLDGVRFSAGWRIAGRTE